MIRRGLVKFLSLFFIVFLMCPRRIRLTAFGKQHYFHAVSRSNNLIDVNLRARSFKSFRGLRQNEEDFIQNIDHEPGFDLSDEEIRKFKLWPKGVILYYIDVVSFNDKVLRDRIRCFLNTVNTQTSLSFMELPSPPKDDKTRWVFFANRRGQLDCADHSILNFTNEGVQHVNLGYDCLSTGGELAEAVLAIVGLPPQHNSPNRDEYIKIVEENIMPEKIYLFRKLNDNEWLFHDTEYDITSAGHYHHHKYSANGKATIEFEVAELKPPDTSFKIKRMGESHAFTIDDIQKLRMLYNYIVRKNENKVPECHKLFRKGHNFRNEISNLPSIEPREKPKKYLGLPESNESPFTESYSVEDPDYKQGKSELIMNLKSSNEPEFHAEHFSGQEVDFNYENDAYEQLGASKKDRKSVAEKSKAKAFLSLSDYQTDA